MVFIPLVYNSGDQNVLINDWYACLQVLSKQLTVWNAYLSLLGYNLVIAPVFSFEPPSHWDRTSVSLSLLRFHYVKLMFDHLQWGSVAACCR